MLSMSHESTSGGDWYTFSLNESLTYSDWLKKTLENWTKYKQYKTKKIAINQATNRIKKTANKTKQKQESK